jgi:hypothetical protein
MRQIPSFLLPLEYRYPCTDAPTSCITRVLKRLISVPGLTWDYVYAALEPHQVNVVGGQVSGVGVGGLILGRGSFHFIYGFTATRS